MTFLIKYQSTVLIIEEFTLSNMSDIRVILKDGYAQRGIYSEVLIVVGCDLLM